MSDPGACLVCGGDLPAQDNGGRPRVYCCQTCRRAAEHEIRRLGRRLEWVETAASQWRLHAGSKQQLARLEAEHERLTGRFLALLDGLGEEVSPPSAAGSEAG